MPSFPQMNVHSKRKCVQKCAKYPSTLQMSFFRPCMHFPEQPGWERHIPASARQAPRRASKSGLWRSRFRANLESRSGGEPWVEGTESGVTSCRLPSLLPSPTRRAVPLAGATGPQLQKSKGGGGLKVETLSKNSSPVNDPHLHPLARETVPK